MLNALLKSLAKGLLPVFALIAALAQPSLAADPRFSIDPSVSLDALTESGRARVSFQKKGNRYEVDASAVLVGADLGKLSTASADYDRYVQMGMPNLRESRVVERSGQDIVFTYSHMSTSGQTSRHYLEVRLFPFGSQWQLTPKRSSWYGREDSVFQALDGSWYMEALSDGRIYVRYFLSADFDTGVPGFLVDLVARRQLPDGVRRVIEVLAAQARR